MANMGAPPSLNLVREIFNVLILMKIDILLGVPLRLTIALAVAFTLVLYSSSQQPQPNNAKHKITPLNPREKVVFFVHLAPIFALTVMLTYLL